MTTTITTPAMMAAAATISNMENGGNNSISTTKPFVRILEQPAKCAIRFRYECEGRSAGSIPGINSTPENKTFPTIQVCNFRGKAVVVVSCVTKEPPYRPHPHNLVGKEGCKKGVCTLVIDNNPDMTCTFTSLGIQCVKRNKIEESLKLRETIKVDPFRTGFSHRTQASSIDLNCLRLCFQVFIEQGPEKGKFTVLPPVVSDAIYDKKAMAELIIVKLSHYSAPCTGGKEIILLCDRVAKDDIQVRFIQESATQGLIWEAFGEFLSNDVHKQVAISLRTPKYFDENITQPITVQIQLRRPSDGCLSLPRSFQITPRELDPDGLVRKRHKRLKEENYDLLQEYIQLASRQQQQQQQSPGPIQQQQQQQQQASTTLPSTTTTTITGITIKTELPSSSSTSSSTVVTSQQQQFQPQQYLHQHSPPSQHVMSDATTSTNMSPVGAGQYLYQQQQQQNDRSFTSPPPPQPASSYEHHHQSSPPTAAALVDSSPTHQQHLHNNNQQHFHQQQQSSPCPSQSSSYPSPIHSPANNQQQQPQQQQQQEIPNEVMERFDSLDIDSSELIPDLDFNSNTMLSLMMDTSSGLSLNDSFSDIVNNNNQLQQQLSNQMNGTTSTSSNDNDNINNNNHNNHSNNIQRFQNQNQNNELNRIKLKLNLQQQQQQLSSTNNNNNNNDTTNTLDTPVIELLNSSNNNNTTSTTTTNQSSYDNNNSILQLDSNNPYLNSLLHNNQQQQQQQLFNELDLENNNHNHITHHI